MIKSHKPRGHFWTHASAFQQTEEFRNIRFEDCAPARSKVLVAGSDENLSYAERSSKRRRIEKLADDFLNGVPLFISSARPCPENLKATINWNENSSKDRYGPISEPQGIEAHEQSVALWEDLDDDAEILKNITRHPQTEVTAGAVDDAVHGSSPNKQREEILVEQAQASCGRPKRPHVPKITVGPSDGALRKAAELRARRMQRAKCEIPIALSGTTLIEQKSANIQEPRSEPDIVHTDNGSHLRAHEWLSRRQSTALRIDVDEDSADELRLSNKTPSAKSQRPSASRLSPGGHEARTHGYAINDNNEVQATVLAPRESPPIDSICDRGEARMYNSQSKASYHTAPEVSEARIAEASTCDEDASPEDSQTRLLRSQGFRGVAVPAWTPINGPPPTEASQSSLRDGPHQSNADSMTAIRKSLQESTRQNSGKPTKSRRARSSRDSAPRTTSSKSAARAGAKPETSHTGADLNVTSEQRPCNELVCVYTNETTTKDGSTPFMFRKKISAPNTGAARTTEQQRSRRRVTFPSSEDGIVDVDECIAQAKQLAIEGIHRVDSHPPVLDVSLEHDSSFAPKLNMALVDEHLNTKLPVESDPGRKVSSVKKALRRELRNSGAEITRCSSEPPTSSQPADEPDKDTDVQPPAGPSQFWPGTQVLLEQAQAALFTSPEKKASSQPCATTTPFGNNATADDHIGSFSRPPLKQLSQEPMPSTQVLLEEFVGFSTVKKPRGALLASPLPTPTQGGKGDGRRNALASSAFGSETNMSGLRASDTHQRPSGLRYSMSTAESPPGSDQSRRSKISKTPAKASVLEFSTTAAVTPMPVPSRQSASTSLRDSAQDHEPLPRDEFHYSVSESQSDSLRDFQRQSSLLSNSKLERTVDELATELLCTKDLEGVLSQV